MKENLRLVSPAPELEGAYHRFVRDWSDRGEEIIPVSARLLGQTYPAWLSAIRAQETAAPEGLVPAHTLFLLEGDDIAGAINIRHALNEYLRTYGGHIGYGVAPSRRGRGYAGRMVRLAAPLCRQLGLERVLITCHAENLASARTIQNLGGRLEGESTDAGGQVFQRYWVEL
jgi:predicted acetyltransferase